LVCTHTHNQINGLGRSENHGRLVAKGFVWPLPRIRSNTSLHSNLTIQGSLVLIGNMSSKHNGYRLSMSLSSQKLDVWITKPWWHHAMLKQGNIMSSLGFAWKQDSIHRLIMSPHQNCYNWVVKHFQRPTSTHAICSPRFNLWAWRRVSIWLPTSRHTHIIVAYELKLLLEWLDRMQYHSCKLMRKVWTSKFHSLPYEFD
jgi:hypothetical protein